MTAISNGFTARDFDFMTIGFLIDCLTETIPEEDRVYRATQEDIDRML
jgi:hypothetical protein